MKVTYDKSVDAVYIYLLDENSSGFKVHDTESVIIDDFIDFPQMQIDINSQKKMLGFEILDASKFLPKEFLNSAVRIDN